LTYYFNTKAGTFIIVSKHGRWHVIFQMDYLGSYPTAKLAISAIASGRVSSFRGRINTANLDIPRDLNKWSRASDL